MAINLDFLRSQCPGVTRPKLLFFQVFDNIFGLNIVFSSISTSQMTRYNKKIEKVHAEKDRDQGNRKKWKW